MIKQFAQYLLQHQNQSNIIFLTGDVGYNALGSIKTQLGNRFINAGIAEQNMINVAAGLASEGFKVYAYSIAPFLLYRAYEQIKINVASSNLDVKLIANGGGYGYGIMGPTHHALNDLSVLNGLPNITGKIPSCTFDVEKCVQESIINEGPEYIRLGLNNTSVSKSFSNGFGTVKVSKSSNSTILALGPLLEEVDSLDADIFTCYNWPVKELSSAFKQSILKTKRLIVLEEHVLHGGLGERMKSLLFDQNIQCEFIHKYAKHYESGFGNQQFHRAYCGLTREVVADLI